MGLVVVDNNILVMEERHCFAVFKSIKIDVERLLIDPLRFVILILLTYNIYSISGQNRTSELL
jgi:hypothetical protein